MRWVLLLVLGVCAASGHAPGPVTCIDSYGNRVDWWIVYKASGTGSYVELTSRDAAAVAGNDDPPHYGRPLSAKRLISDADTSPMLLTVYENLGRLDARGQPKRGDNRVFMAWNDQPPAGARELRGTQHTLAGDENTPITEIPVALNTRSHGMVLEPERSDESDGTDAVEADALARMHDLVDRRPVFEEDPTERAFGAGGADLDMYGAAVDGRCAHSKGMLGLGVDTVRGVASFYLVTHSFPMIPTADAWLTDEPVKRRRPPTNRSAFFGTNITGPRSKAQHAMCLSMTQAVEVDGNGEIVFDAAAIDHERQNLFALLDGLDVIQPAMVMTDYNPWVATHRLYHRLFNGSTAWRPSRPLAGIVESSLNAPRTRGSAVVRSPHAFVLWPVDNRVRVRTNGDGTYTVLPVEAMYSSSLRAPVQYDRARCGAWDAEDHARGASPRWNGAGAPGGERCFLSATLRTTADDGEALVLTADYKHGLLAADFDDVVRRHLVPAEDAEAALATSAADASSRVRIAYVVVSQSWFDHATQGPHRYVLSDGPDYRVVAWFQNSVAVHLPAEVEISDTTVLHGAANTPVRALLQPSVGRDHSKWFVAYLYGAEDPPVDYHAVAGFCDTNRNSKTTLLAGRPHGRGGALYATRAPPVVRFLYGLQPLFEDTSSFAHVDLGLVAAACAPPARLLGHPLPAVASVQLDVNTTTTVRLPFACPADAPDATGRRQTPRKPTPYSNRKPARSSSSSSDSDSPGSNTRKRLLFAPFADSAVKAGRENVGHGVGSPRNDHLERFALNQLTSPLHEYSIERSHDLTRERPQDHHNDVPVGHSHDHRDDHPNDPSHGHSHEHHHDHCRQPSACHSYKDSGMQDDHARYGYSIMSPGLDSIGGMLDNVPCAITDGSMMQPCHTAAEQAMVGGHALLPDQRVFGEDCRPMDCVASELDEHGSDGKDTSALLAATKPIPPMPSRAVRYDRDVDAMANEEFQSPLFSASNTVTPCRVDKSNKYILGPHRVCSATKHTPMTLSNAPQTSRNVRAVLGHSDSLHGVHDQSVSHGEDTLSEADTVLATADELPKKRSRSDDDAPKGGRKKPYKSKSRRSKRPKKP